MGTVKKYVIFKVQDLLHPVIFPEHVTHSAVKLQYGTPISAGFFTTGEIFGSVMVLPMESISLNLGPHKDDEKVLQAAMNGDSNIAKYLIGNYDYFKKLEQ